MTSQINKATAVKLFKAIAKGEINLSDFPELRKQKIDLSKLSVDEMLQLRALMEKCIVKNKHLEK